MAIFRKVHVSFWSDPFTSELNRDQKLFYLYLITNERTNQCGIYEITKRQIGFDLQYSIDTVSKHIRYFEDRGKIKYSEDTCELALKNWSKFNGSASPKVQALVDKQLKDVKDRLLIEYINSIDTISRVEPEPEPEKKENKKENYDNLHSLQKFILDRCPNVSKLTGQLTFEEAEKLMSQFPKKSIADKLAAMENKADLKKKYTSVYLTLLNWLKKDSSANVISQPKEARK